MSKSAFLFLLIGIKLDSISTVLLVILSILSRFIIYNFKPIKFNISYLKGFWALGGRGFGFPQNYSNPTVFIRFSGPVISQVCTSKSVHAPSDEGPGSVRS